MRTSHELLDSDAEHLWHPYAATVDPAPVQLVRAASGVRLELDCADGTRRSVVDAMSSWWCMIHGYRNPVLDAALVEQAGRFSHVMFGGLTHEPAIELAEQLLAMAHGVGLTRLGRVFLADSGSVAMEVALKLARQVAAVRHGVGQRTRVAALRGGYHGDTLGTMAVCDPVGGMHSLHADSLVPQVFLPRPPRAGCDEAELLVWRGESSRIVAEHAHELAAVCCEPLLQGAGGMWTYDARCLVVLRELCDRFGLLLVVDEIATGFGRTGELFASAAAGVQPDVMAVGKAMTGGYLTQAAVLVDDSLATELSLGVGGALMHGPTFMANPLACAVSLASLGILATGQWRDDVARIGAELHAGLSPLAGSPVVRDVRVLGATGAVELTRDVDMALATRVALEHGVWLRPFRRCVYTMPPFVSTSSEVAEITAAIAAVVTAHEALGETHPTGPKSAAENPEEDR